MEWSDTVQDICSKVLALLAWYSPIGSTQTEPIDPQAFGRAFGIGSSGASLIRPDGYVAWRVEELVAQALAEALRMVGTR
jgi:hypothetical protein